MRRARRLPTARRGRRGSGAPAVTPAAAPLVGGPPRGHRLPLVPPRGRRLPAARACGPTAGLVGGGGGGGGRIRQRGQEEQHSAKCRCHRHVRRHCHFHCHRLCPYRGHHHCHRRGHHLPPPPLPLSLARSPPPRSPPPRWSCGFALGGRPVSSLLSSTCPSLLFRLFIRRPSGRRWLIAAVWVPPLRPSRSPPLRPRRRRPFVARRLERSPPATPSLTVTSPPPPFLPDCASSCTPTRASTWWCWTWRQLPATALVALGRWSSGPMRWCTCRRRQWWRDRKSVV